MPRPDFFHVGHPRSATGLVYSWLSKHPDIFMARKELHGFGSDIGFNDPPRTLDNYLSYFREAGDRKRIGDSSTWYLASSTAADEIHAFRPDARIIATLRNPIDMLESLHAHLYANGDEEIGELGAAWDAQEDRMRGRRIPPGSIPRIALRYREHCRYAEQLERYFRRFGRDNVHVVVFDDIKADAGAVYRGILRFLGVREDFPGIDEVLQGNARARNSNWTVRSRRVQRWVKRPTNQAVYMGLREPPVPGWFQVLRVLRRINAVQVDRRRVDPAVRRRIAAEVLPDVERLETLLGRDLGAWKKAAR